jgi:hypothetical protein
VNEKTVTEVRVRNEHQKEVNVPAHWAYLLGVIGGALVLMLALIAVLGATGG